MRVRCHVQLSLVSPGAPQGTSSISGRHPGGQSWLAGGLAFRLVSVQGHCPQRRDSHTHKAATWTSRVSRCTRCTSASSFPRVFLNSKSPTGPAGKVLKLCGFQGGAFQSHCLPVGLAAQGPAVTHRRL